MKTLFVYNNWCHILGKKWTFLEGGEVHDTICDNKYVLDFIVEPLEDPNPYYYYSTVITLGGF